ncbi:MAG TPA: SRPBCC family protein, partial [Solirubrobacterales bacterium]|nr:SRPBCC family protein [Solirubrobacterales bacterium]
MASFTYARQVAAPPETVFEVLTDHRGYAKITPLRKAELEREGEPAPNGVGAIRKLSAVGPPLREEVLAYEPGRRFAMTWQLGRPRDKSGEVEVTFQSRGPDHCLITLTHS